MRSLLLISICCSTVSAESIAIPEPQADIIYNSCVDCHDKETKKGGLNLDVLKVDWSKKENLKHWRERILKVELKS